MSALDGWIDVCRTGNWRDARGRDVAIDEARLDRIVEAHAGADPAPVVVGHPETDAPAYAWIDGLRRSGDRLQATLRDIAPAFREAVEGGRYAGRSIALQGDTLRHLGFLGGRAPAVPGLAPTQFADKPETVVAFAAAALAGPVERAAFGAMARIARGMRERIIATDGQDAADATVPDWEIETLAEAAKPPPAAADEARPFLAAPDATPHAIDEAPADNRQEGDMPKSEAELAAESAALDERKTALDEQKADQDQRETALAAREAARQAADRLAAATATLKPHVEAGRVPPAEAAALAALLASLPDGDGETVTFAAADGAEASEAPRAIFERHLAGLPVRIDYGTRAGGAAPAAQGEDNPAIAAEARELVAEAGAKGRILTVPEAVDRVRAKRGLPTG